MIDKRARDRDRARGWWDQHLARGTCGVCHHALDPDATRGWHRDCLRLVWCGVRCAVIRAMTPEAIRQAATEARRT